MKKLYIWEIEVLIKNYKKYLIKMDDKIRQMEDEMIRFEAELGSQIMTTSRPVIGANTYNQVARQLEHHELPASAVVAAAPVLPYPPVSSIISFPPAPSPHQIVEPSTVSNTYSSSDQLTSPFIANIINSLTSLSNTMIHPDRMSSKISESETKKLKAKGVSTAAELAISQGKASSIMANANNGDNLSKGKGRKNKKVLRMAGGQTWEDSSLMDWDEDDFRIFCGDLGNDVTDDMLVRVFKNYPSFQKAKVIRDKRTNKTKGFGFVSFKDPQDFIRAMKEMNGRYVGSRPIKLRKSSWKQRNLDTVRRKEKEKQCLIGLLTGQ